MMLLGQVLPSPATMLFNHLIRGIIPVINRPSVGINNDDGHPKAIIKRQIKNDKGKDTYKILVSLPIGSIVVVQWEDGGPWTHGKTEATGDHNHHDRSYHICIVINITEYQVITTSTPSIALLVLTNQSSAIDDIHTVYKHLHL